MFKLSIIQTSVTHQRGQNSLWSKTECEILSKWFLFFYSSERKSRDNFCLIKTTFMNKITLPKCYYIAYMITAILFTLLFLPSTLLCFIPSPLITLYVTVDLLRLFFLRMHMVCILPGYHDISSQQ